MDPPQTRYAKSGDISIAYQVVGTGPHILPAIRTPPAPGCASKTAAVTR